MDGWVGIAVVMAFFIEQPWCRRHIIRGTGPAAQLAVRPYFRARYQVVGKERLFVVGRKTILIPRLFPSLSIFYTILVGDRSFRRYSRKGKRGREAATSPCPLVGTSV